jgi:flagellar biosynthesis protein FliQ
MTKGETKFMEQGFILEFGQRALLTIIYVSAPILGLSLIVGLAVSIFQATTQIQEQTLAFIPKILAVLGGVSLFGAWMLRIMIEFMRDVFLNMNTYIR